MIRDRYLVSVIARGRYVDERLFTSLVRASCYAHGAAVAMAKTAVGDARVDVKDRKRQRSVNLLQVRGFGTARMTGRKAREILCGKEKKK